MPRCAMCRATAVCCAAHAPHSRAHSVALLLVLCRHLLPPLVLRLGAAVESAKEILDLLGDPTKDESAAWLELCLNSRRPRDVATAFRCVHVCCVWCV
jgi:hypothetical protein